MPTFTLDDNDEEESFIASRLKEKQHSRQYAETIREALKTEYAIYTGDVGRLIELHPDLLRDIVQYVTNVTQETPSDI